MADELQESIDSYIASHWNDVLADIESLVQIESTENLAEAAPNAPYGPGPRKALDQALEIAERMGLQTHDCSGHIGYADLPGESEIQLGIIGHVDVVPAGPGWSFEPYAVTHKDGYLLGRGVCDDKGPIIVALHAVNFWAQRGVRFPYTIRVLFGANEETNMKDVNYYRAHYADPAFLFTPDAQFPVCYGEAGICSGTLTSGPLQGGVVKVLEGGVAVNAVPGAAHAVIEVADEGRLSKDAFPATNEIEVTFEEGQVVLHAKGKSAHASTPELGINAIDILASYLLEHCPLAPGEREFLQLARRVTSHCDGSGLGVQTADEHFGDLTSVGGTIAFDGERMRLTIDFRYPTSITSDEIERRVQSVAEESHATFEMQHSKTPFLIDPASDVVKAMARAYNEATGEHAEPFTMKGGTYARQFSSGVSFGAEKPWEYKPDWVGGMHGPNEGIREDLLKQALAIYIRTIDSLMKLDLQ